MAGRDPRNQTESDRFYKSSRLPIGPAVYFFQVESGPIKIGFTSNVRHRFIGVQTGNHEEVNVIGWIENATRSDERELHQRLAQFRIRGEWFKAEPAVLAAVVRR